MGTWGTGVFSDDDAADVRDRYRELLGDGKSGEEATDILLEEWNSGLDNTVFWLALAATQWRCGRLEDRVKTRALRIIDNGADLERWKETGNDGELRKRSAVLQHLRRQLDSPAPKKLNVKKRYRSTTDWQRGELVAYKLRSGKNIIFRVIGIEGDKGGTRPVCEILDWVGELIPNSSELGKMSIRRCVGFRENNPPQLGIGRASSREYPEDRITRLTINLQPTQELCLPRVFTLWRFLDSSLEDCFGLR